MPFPADYCSLRTTVPCGLLSPTGYCSLWTTVPCGLSFPGGLFSARDNLPPGNAVRKGRPPPWDGFPQVSLDPMAQHKVRLIITMSVIFFGGVVWGIVNYVFKPSAKG
ncbi:hypothetical protein L228DRAFT_130118 [Xylona heveae TC161]|uniref:Uncharacterized protein n=1 Tax=Xylona heveae (strain CBS 132557 / TC161) TaxID=1328760 RepID=A0A165GUW2_XYLHT|nr:hypothetical protein L228DRAFT_130118 [Xylona heveae TC161]KZF22624.1 hypothetical protein L228DRAFT_130118 [Xylona heveae TC161]